MKMQKLSDGMLIFYRASLLQHCLDVETAKVVGVLETFGHPKVVASAEGCDESHFLAKPWLDSLLLNPLLCQSLSAENHPLDSICLG
jgi:hypothetical protein